MSEALSLARRGLYTTDPNPRVGCVLVRDGNVVGRGWHERAGEAHAEVNAIADAGNDAQGATAYVSLEPCCHHARTGPCTEALIGAGVRRVVAAMTDPNPRVSGRGLARLEEQGMDVRSGVLEPAARALNPGFIKRMSSGSPYVRVKLAMSVDGRTAMASGESQWITGPAARRDVQRLRARSSAIVTGVRTVVSDDPSLTVRPEAFGQSDALPPRQPLRVIMDSSGRTPADAKLMTLPGETLIATCTASSERLTALRAAGAQTAVLPAQQHRVDLTALLSELASREANEVLVEAGQTLAGAMLESGCVDELIIYAAPKLLGADARDLVELAGVSTLAQAVKLEFVDVRKVGTDIRLVLRPLPATP